MNKIIHKIRVAVIALTIVVSVFGTVSAVVQAQVATPFLPGLGTPAVPEVRITTIEQIYGILDRITGWLFIFFFAIAIVFILIGAFYYLVDKEGKGAEKGKAQLKNAAIAIIIALVARGIPFLLQTIISPGGVFF